MGRCIMNLKLTLGLIFLLLIKFKSAQAEVETMTCTLDKSSNLSDTYEAQVVYDKVDESPIESRLYKLNLMKKMSSGRYAAIKSISLDAVNARIKKWNNKKNAGKTKSAIFSIELKDGVENLPAEFNCQVRQSVDL
jgi:hypothetical protein